MRNLWYNICNLKNSLNYFGEKNMAIEFAYGITARVTEQMNEEIEALAKKEQRPVSNLLRVLIAEALYYRKLGIGPDEFEEFMKSRKK